MKKILLIALFMIGCQQAEAGKQDTYGLRHGKITVNGKQADCVIYDTPSRGGVSCNWEAYNRNTRTEAHP